MKSHSYPLPRIWNCLIILRTFSSTWHSRAAWPPPFVDMFIGAYLFLQEYEAFHYGFCGNCCSKHCMYILVQPTPFIRYNMHNGMHPCDIEALSWFSNFRKLSRFNKFSGIKVQCKFLDTYERGDYVQYTRFHMGFIIFTTKEINF